MDPIYLLGIADTGIPPRALREIKRGLKGPVTLTSPIFVTTDCRVGSYKYWTEAAVRKLSGRGLWGKRSRKNIFEIREYFS
jgi:hypothetical protein